MLAATATVDDLISWHPCTGWPPKRIRALAQKIGGDKLRWSAEEILDLSVLTISDRLWIVLRPELISDRLLGELGCRFAAHVLRIYEQSNPTDTRPREAIAIKRLWLLGQASDDELSLAREAATGAAGATEASWAAARAAARAARSATRAARSAVVTAARASDAARAAARSAARAAGEAGEAEEAESVWQIGVVRELLTRLPENGITGDADRQG